VSLNLLVRWVLRHSRKSKLIFYTFYIGLSHSISVVQCLAYVKCMHIMAYGRELHVWSVFPLEKSPRTCYGGSENRRYSLANRKLTKKNKSMKINWRLQPLVGDVLRPTACSEVRAIELMIDGSVSVAWRARVPFDNYPAAKQFPTGTLRSWDISPDTFRHPCRVGLVATTPGDSGTHRAGSKETRVIINRAGSKWPGPWPGRRVTPVPVSR